MQVQLDYISDTFHIRLGFWGLGSGPGSRVQRCLNWTKLNQTQMGFRVWDECPNWTVASLPLQLKPSNL